MECKETAMLPEGDEWQYELKLDGYRAVAVKQHNEVRLYSRNGKLFNGKFPDVVSALERLPAKSFILDGEIVAVDEEGRHSFSLLQNIGTSRAPVLFYVFDALNLHDLDLMGLPLSKRRAALEQELAGVEPPLHLSPILEAALPDVIATVKELAFEGVVAKRIDSPYVSGERPGTWQKHKLQTSDDFLVGGYISGGSGVDEIAVGIKEGKGLFYVEAVKNGFVPATRKLVRLALEPLQTDRCPFSNLPERKGAHRMDREKMARVVWVRPKIVVEVAFNEWTPSRHLRHARFMRLRDDV